jgi:2-dehydropantoate 2-reductase
VTVVARESTAELIDSEGISVASATLGSFDGRPRAAAQLEKPVDVLFVATKAIGLEQALDRIAVAPALVIPLLNGLDGVALLRSRFTPDNVAAGTIRIEADRQFAPPPHARPVIAHTSKFLLVEVASDRGGAAAAALPGVVAALTTAGIPARIGKSEKAVLWSKLVRLNSLASTTAAADRTIGFIRSDPVWRARLIACITETAAVATADGAPSDPAVAIAELDSVHDTLGSSMQRDIAAGRTPELDAIQGSVLRAAARHGLSCPMVIELAAEIAARAGIAPPTF